MSAAPAAATSARPVVAIGEALVEIMADEAGCGFGAPIGLTGPFPSGAPAIFTGQVARLGLRAALISRVGDDDFGRLLLDRLAADGADVGAVAVDPDRPTGTAFVRYRPDGQRDFILNIRHSASGAIRVTAPARERLATAAHLHVVGSSLSSPPLIEAVRTAVTMARAAGGTVSFDPNVRADLASAPALREACDWMLRRCDIFLPSGEELTLLADLPDADRAVARILSLGVREIVVKHGAAGASHHDRAGRLDVAPFPVREVDPTGAGDCFGATFVVCRLQGRPTDACLRYAAASGARAVARRGPMEGTAGFAELDAMIGRPR